MSLYEFLLVIENIWCELISVDIVMWYLLGDIPRFAEGYFDIFPKGNHLFRFFWCILIALGFLKQIRVYYSWYWLVIIWSLAWVKSRCVMHFTTPLYLRFFRKAVWIFRSGFVSIDILCKSCTGVWALGSGVLSSMVKTSSTHTSGYFGSDDGFESQRITWALDATLSEKTVTMSGGASLQVFGLRWLVRNWMSCVKL